jgi:energy-converting hydrogenase Eha subunit G
MIAGVTLESRLIGLKGFMVLFKEEMAISFFMIGLNEVRVFFEGDFVVLFSPLEIHKLNVDLTHITIILGDIGISSDGFFVFFESLREFA